MKDTIHLRLRSDIVDSLAAVLANGGKTDQGIATLTFDRAAVNDFFLAFVQANGFVGGKKGEGPDRIEPDEPWPWERS